MVSRFATSLSHRRYNLVAVGGGFANLIHSGHLLKHRLGNLHLELLLKSNQNLETQGVNIVLSGRLSSKPSSSATSITSATIWCTSSALFSISVFRVGAPHSARIVVSVGGTEENLYSENFSGESNFKVPQ